MSRKSLRCGVAVLMLAAAVAGNSGCNLFAPIFLFHYFTGADTRLPPDYEIREGDKDKPVRVMVLTYKQESLNLEQADLDRELNDKVSRALFKGFAADKKNIHVIRADVVKKWLDQHPDWKSMEAAEIGEALQADFVICLQIDEFRLFKDQRTREIFQGRCDITCRVVPVHPEDAMQGVETLPISVELPKGNGWPVSETGKTVRQMRDWFIANLAERITWKFLPHQRENEYGRDSF